VGTRCKGAGICTQRGLQARGGERKIAFSDGRTEKESDSRQTRLGDPWVDLPCLSATILMMITVLLPLDTHSLAVDLTMSSEDSSSPTGAGGGGSGPVATTSGTATRATKKDLTRAIQFLIHPRVRESSHVQKTSFLEKKGFTKEVCCSWRIGSCLRPPIA